MSLTNILRNVYHGFSGAACPFPAVEWADEVIQIADNEITLSALSFKWGDLNDPRALVLLCRLVAAGYAPAFEFGTFRGRTTLNMALNLKDDAYVATLDTEIDDSSSNVDGHPYPTRVSGELVTGARPEVRARVKLLRGDSRSFDFGPYEKQFRLVFIDAGHSYEAVMNDSKVAFRLLRPDGGIIVWDDYGTYWPGVKKALDELSRTRPLVLVRSANVVMCKVEAS